VVLSLEQGAGLQPGRSRDHLLRGLVVTAAVRNGIPGLRRSGFKRLLFGFGRHVRSFHEAAKRSYTFARG
jgi:hypothetical protein